MLQDPFHGINLLLTLEKHLEELHRPGGGRSLASWLKLKPSWAPGHPLPPPGGGGPTISIKISSMLNFGLYHNISSHLPNVCALCLTSQAI